MSYQINAAWLKRTSKLKFKDLLKTAKTVMELKQYAKVVVRQPQLLDVGVGLGYETAYFLTKGARVTALDANKPVLDALRNRCVLYPSQLETVHQKVPFGEEYVMDKTFDLIIVSNVLHYLEWDDIRICVDQLSQLLRPNGIMVVRAHSTQHPYNQPNHSKKNYYKHFFSLNDIDILFPSDKFTILYKASYYKVYSREECRLFGYTGTENHFKYGISAILKKMIT